MNKLFTTGFLFLIFTNIYSQVIRNASFETGTIDSWIFANPAYYGFTKDAGFTCSVEQYGVKKNYAAKLKNTGNGSWGQLKQKIAYHTNADLRKVRVSVLMKIENMHNGYANISATPQVQGKTFAFVQSKKYFKNIDWKTITVDIILPPFTDSLTIFCTTMSDGTAWFDNISIDKMSETIRQSSIAKKYLDTALYIIGKNALYKDSVNFKELCANAQVIAADAKRTKDCYNAIRYVLEGLGDNHSQFTTPEDAKDIHDDGQGKLTYPVGKILNNNIGYITVPPLLAVNEKIEKLYADSMQHLIRALDSKMVIGWIVDVRNNTGGNGFPMILGLGPVIGNGIFNRKIKDGIVTDSSGYWDGVVRDKTGIVSVQTNPYTLISPFPYVAVLTNGMTASSGEGVVLRFKNRPKAKIFGEPTYGLTTANDEFPLTDGAIMLIAMVKQTDRLGNKYGGKIYPDVEVIDSDATLNDEVIDTAVRWLIENANK